MTHKQNNVKRVERKFVFFTWKKSLSLSVSSALHSQSVSLSHVNGHFCKTTFRLVKFNYDSSVAKRSPFRSKSTYFELKVLGSESKISTRFWKNLTILDCWLDNQTHCAFSVKNKCAQGSALLCSGNFEAVARNFEGLHYRDGVGRLPTITLISES